MTQGIYIIRCLKNGKNYVGSSVNIRLRINRHKSMLQRGIHFSSHLQYSYNKYGSELFDFIILEIVENNKELINKEQFWVNELKANNPLFGYNSRLVVQSRKGIKSSEETKRKISLSNTGRIVSQETRDKLSKANKGYKHSEETKLKLSLSQKGIPRPMKESTKLKLSIAHKGKKLSKEHKDKLSIAHTGYKHKEETKIKMSITKLANRFNKEL